MFVNCLKQTEHLNSVDLQTIIFKSPCKSQEPKSNFNLSDHPVFLPGSRSDFNSNNSPARVLESSSAVTVTYGPRRRPSFVTIGYHVELNSMCFASVYLFVLLKLYYLGLLIYLHHSCFNINWTANYPYRLHIIHE